MAQAPQSPFGIIPTGLPPITSPSQITSPTSFVYALPERYFSHLVVFLLPGTNLPPDAAAAIYIMRLDSPDPGSFQFLGGIGIGKESAIFKIKPFTLSTRNGQVDMGFGSSGGFVLGISIEPEDFVAAHIAALSSTSNSSTVESNSLASMNINNGLVKPDASKIAQNLVKNFYNFVASYDGQGDTVPLKAFQEYCKKLESRLKHDPSFLEKGYD